MNSLWNICFADSRAGFAQIRDSTPILFPAFFILVCITLEFSFLGFSFLVLEGENISSIDSDSSEGWLLFDSGLITIISLVLGMLGFVLVWWLFTSTYYFGLARLFNIKIPWRNWLGFSCWSSIPLITVPIFVVIATVVQTFSVLVGGEDPWYIELTSACLLILPFIWCVRISALGLRSWTEPAGRGHIYWRVVAFVPYILLLFTFLIYPTTLMGIV